MPDDLDVRIRELVARAVADAPPAPELDSEAALTEPGPTRRGWWIGGGAALLAAAALAATFVLVGPGDDSVTTPATGPSTTSATQPVPATTIPATTTTPSTTTMAPATVEPDVVLTAGPAGVVERRGGEVRTLTAEPMAIALDVGDGRTLVQRAATANDDTFDTTPLLLADDGSSSPLFDTVDWGGAVRLHDVEVVGGRRLLLFSLAGPLVPQEANEDLYVVDLDTAERTLVAEDVGGWEFGTGRLQLTTTGLIAGEASAEASHGLFVAAVPGSPADGDLPTAEHLGIDTTFVDCDTCPRMFSPAIGGLAWVDESDVVINRLDGSPPERIRLPFVAGCCGSLDPTADGGFLLSASVPELTPVLIAADGTVTTLEGRIATAGPRAGSEAPTVPVTTTVPSTTTTTEPAPPAGVMLATAGDDGITVIENGIELRRLDQPAEIALLTPGGAVVFQPQRLTPDGTPGDPLIWRPDGSVESLLGPLAANQSYRLHDLATINGVPTLLYGVSSRGTVDPGEEFVYEDYTEVVYALTMTPGNWTTVEVAAINTWEGGFDRLALSIGGTIVGTSRAELSSSFFSAVLPGSPDAAAGPPSHESLGLQSNYSECWVEGCPDLFTISHDGESIVWTEGAEITVFDTVTGERVRSWTVPSLQRAMTQPQQIGLLVDSIDVRTSSDGGVEAAISFGSPRDPPVVPAVVAATSPPGDVTETEVQGRVVTFGP